MAFAIKNEKVKNELLQFENKVRKSLEEILDINENWRPTIRENTLFFGMNRDIRSYKQHYDDDPYTKLEFMRFNKNNWGIVEYNDWVKFDFVMTIYSVAVNKKKKWSIRFKLEAKLPFWLEVD